LGATGQSAMGHYGPEYDAPGDLATAQAYGRRIAGLAKRLGK
jgi:hypothetical protein